MKRSSSPLIGRILAVAGSPAAGLAIAMIVSNVISLAASVVFARQLTDYGALAALISYLLILTVAGQALQVATARDSVVGLLGEGQGLIATLRRWMKTLGIATLVLTVISILLRHPIASLVGVPHQSWAAAAGIPAACAYVAVCTVRGALQGIGRFSDVGVSLVAENALRLAAGASLAAIGLGVGGAYLGSLIGYTGMAVYCWWRLHLAVAAASSSPAAAVAPSATQSSLTLWSHLRAAAIPIAALAIIQLLQNIDLIVAKHIFSENLASAYAATAVAAKVLIWVAMGAGFYLVPETSKRQSTGADPRVVLLQSLGIIFACAIPALAIFGVAGHELLSIVFGTKRAIASGALLPLGAAFSVLACTYLAVQYMLALNRVRFLIGLGAVAVLEPILLLQAPKHAASFAMIVLAVQAIGAAVAFIFALWRK